MPRPTRFRFFFEPASGRRSFNFISFYLFNADQMTHFPNHPADNGIVVMLDSLTELL
jgi:hypothetical protein